MSVFREPMGAIKNSLLLMTILTNELIFLLHVTNSIASNELNEQIAIFGATMLVKLSKYFFQNFVTLDWLESYKSKNKIMKASKLYMERIDCQIWSSEFAYYI